MGKTGHSLACALIDKNFSVTVWDRDKDKLSVIEKNGIDATGAIEGHYSVKVEPDIKKAIANADYITVNTLAGGHRDIANLIKGSLSNGQKILIFNGNWGIMEFKDILQDEIEKKDIVLIETSGMHLMTDLPEVGHPHIKKIKKSLGISIYPKRHQETTFKELLEIFPQFFLLKSPIYTSMDASNPILHAPIALGLFSKIEGGQDNFFYREGATPSIVRFIEKIDKERIDVMRSLDSEGTTCLQIINKAWGKDSSDLYEAIHLNYDLSRGPKSIEYRFITEDVPFGIVPIVKLGRLFNVETPYSELLVSMYSALMDRSFMDLGPSFLKESVLSLN